MNVKPTATNVATTTTTATFTHPAPGNTVTVSVGSTSWMNVGSKVFITGGGVYIVTAIASATSATLKNPGYAGNAVSGASVANPANVFQMESRYATGVSDPDNAFSPSVTLAS